MGLLPFVMPKLERARGGGRPDRRRDEGEEQTMASAEATQAEETVVVEETVVEDAVAVADEA